MLLLKEFFMVFFFLSFSRLWWRLALSCLLFSLSLSVSFGMSQHFSRVFHSYTCSFIRALFRICSLFFIFLYYNKNRACFIHFLYFIFEKNVRKKFLIYSKQICLILINLFFYKKKRKKKLEKNKFKFFPST